MDNDDDVGEVTMAILNAIPFIHNSQLKAKMVTATNKLARLTRNSKTNAYVAEVISLTKGLIGKDSLDAEIATAEMEVAALRMKRMSN
jgi:hypothetical protein